MGEATEALEKGLAALKEELLEWKGRYETIHEERLALERKLHEEVAPPLTSCRFIWGFNLVFILFYFYIFLWFRWLLRLLPLVATRKRRTLTLSPGLASLPQPCRRPEPARVRLFSNTFLQ